MLADLARGDVILVKFPSHQPRGREQEGQRPAVIVGIPQGTVRCPVILVAPLTTQVGDWAVENPTLYPRLEAGIGRLSKTSIVLIDQLKAIDVRRVIAYLGTLPEEQLRIITTGLKQILET